VRGRGTRLQEKTQAIPKALVEIGGKPILWHVMRIYAAQGFRRFLLLTGYKGDTVADFALRERWPEPVEVECIDTGTNTPTGGRVARITDRLRDGTFCLTYADGIADIDLSAQRDFHEREDALATMTVVRPYAAPAAYSASVRRPHRLDGLAEAVVGGQGLIDGRQAQQPPDLTVRDQRDVGATVLQRLGAVQQHRQADRVHEYALRKVDHERVLGVLGGPVKRLANPRRRVEHELATDRDHVDALSRLLADLEIGGHPPRPYSTPVRGIHRRGGAD
jgi:hypothetical protein